MDWTWREWVLVGDHFLIFVLCGYFMVLMLEIVEDEVEVEVEVVV